MSRGTRDTSGTRATVRGSRRRGRLVANKDVLYLNDQAGMLFSRLKLPIVYLRSTAQEYY
jgi:hypothetical protein